MHIMEGFLPIGWAVFWTLVAVPFIIYGIYKVKKLFDENPEKKITLAFSGAFIVLLSSLKIPSVGGSSSHPTGTGMSVIFSGPYVTSVLCLIVLIFQATFMAHGGFTTLGANVFSMGIAGPFVAFGLFKLLQRTKINPSVKVFAVTFVADMMTYFVTSIQLALVVPGADIGTFFNAMTAFLSIFAITQIPIAIIEGLLMVFFFAYLAEIKPEMVEGLGYKKKERTTSLEGKEHKKLSKEKTAMISFIVLLATIVLATYIAVFVMGGSFIGADDQGAGKIIDINPDYFKWTENFIQLGEATINVLFIIQTVIGILIIAGVVWFLLFRKKHEHGSEYTTVDTIAYKSPMLNWSPLLKFGMIILMLILNIATPSLLMTAFTGFVGLVLLFYASSFKIPSIMVRIFVYAEFIVLISALLFSVVTPGTSVVSMNIFGLAIHFTAEGIGLAVMMFARATSAMLLMFAFAVSTPVPHLSASLKKIRIPDAFVELLILVYRYSFLLMESMERMHLAAECRFGYSTLSRSIRTTARLATGVFVQSLDTAERGQKVLQCRNYNGSFYSLSQYGKKDRKGACICIILSALSVAVFILVQFVM